MVLFAVLIATVELPTSLPGSSTTSYWVASAVVAPLFFATLLAHEVAHAVTARHYGIRVRRITLWMLGGLTELEGEAPTPRADALIAAAGPAASLAIGAACAGAAWSADRWSTDGWAVVPAALAWLAGINVLLGIFNLLPGAPWTGADSCGPCCGGAATTGPGRPRGRRRQVGSSAWSWSRSASWRSSSEARSGSGPCSSGGSSSTAPPPSSTPRAPRPSPG